MMPQIRFVLSIMVWFFCKIDSYLSPEYDCDLLAELSKFTTAIFTQNGPGWKKLVFGVKIATLQSLTGHTLFENESITDINYPALF